MQRILRTFILIMLLMTTIIAGVGDPAPDFTLSTLDGSTVSLSDFKGKIVYIFWFSYN